MVEQADGLDKGIGAVECGQGQSIDTERDRRPGFVGQQRGQRSRDGADRPDPVGTISQ